MAPSRNGPTSQSANLRRAVQVDLAVPGNVAVPGTARRPQIAGIRQSAELRSLGRRTGPESACDGEVTPRRRTLTSPPARRGLAPPWMLVPAHGISSRRGP